MSVPAVSAHAGTWSTLTSYPFAVPTFTMIAPSFNSTGTSVEAGNGPSISMQFASDWTPDFPGDASPSMIAEHSYEHEATQVKSSVSPLSTDAWVRTLTEPVCTLSSYQSVNVVNYYPTVRAEANPNKVLDTANLAAASKVAQIIIQANQDGIQFNAWMSISNEGLGYSDVSAHSESTGLTLKSTNVRFFKPTP